MLFPLRLTFWLIVTTGVLWIVPFALDRALNPQMVDQSRCTMPQSMCQKLTERKLHETD